MSDGLPSPDSESIEKCPTCKEPARCLGYGSATMRPRWYCQECGTEWWGKYPVTQALARKAAQALNSSRTPEERQEAARKAANARWDKMGEREQ